MSEFWLGVLLSVPIGIITSLVTPAIQRSIEHRSNKLSQKHNRRKEREEKIILYFDKNPDEYTQYMTYIIIKVTFIMAVTGAIAGFLYAINQLLMFPAGMPPSQDFVKSGYFKFMMYAQQSLFFIGQLTSTIGALMVINTCKFALSTWRRLRFGRLPT